MHTAAAPSSTEEKIHTVVSPTLTQAEMQSAESPNQKRVMSVSKLQPLTSVSTPSLLINLFLKGW